MNKQNELQRRSLGAGMRQSWVVLIFWAMFATGLVIQVAAPRLKIENRAFVMPPITDARGPALRPDLLVTRERWMQFFSGVLTVGGAVALGYCYRRKVLVALKG